jgi:hypothetical protein
MQLHLRASLPVNFAAVSGPDARRAGAHRSMQRRLRNRSRIEYVAVGTDAQQHALVHLVLGDPGNLTQVPSCDTYRLAEAGK